MNRQKPHKIIQQAISELTDNYISAYPYIPLYEKRLPEANAFADIMETIRAIMFPGYFGSPLVNINSIQYHAGVNIEKLYSLLSDQIYRTLSFNEQAEKLNFSEVKEKAACLTLDFISRFPKIKNLLSTDVEAILTGDPAAKDHAEIIFCYPAMRAMLNHRVAHELYKLDIPLIPRLISEIAHSETGIDIHPGAQIDEYFSIDHGTGVVIGQTAIVGKHVRLYQGVTLGAKSFVLDESGIPLDVPRHPILEDYVTVYSNSSILGRITIGAGTIVGGNVWLTHSVPPNSKILQSKAVQYDFIDGLGI